MKTTIDIAPALLLEARRVASKQKTTLKALVEQGLREVLAERKHPKPYKLPDMSVAGNGLQPEFQGASWQEILDASYEGRGTPERVTGTAFARRRAKSLR